MTNKVVDNIYELIGDTPMLKIDSSIHGIENVEIYAKLEYMNPFGSLKDRVAWEMIKDDIDHIQSQDKTILEASSGNTGKALSALAGIIGSRFHSVSNRIKTPEVRQILQVLGAHIEELPGYSECSDPSDPNDFTTIAQQRADGDSCFFYTDQYNNPKNVKAHKKTGQEIHNAIGKVDYFFNFLGTCGSSTGIGDEIRNQNPNAKIIGIATESGHYVPGGRSMAELFEVGFFQNDYYEDIIAGTSYEAVEATLELNRKLGLMCGPTSGLTYYSLIKYLKEHEEELRQLPAPAKVVFLACDRVEPYMSYMKERKPELFVSKRATKKRVSQIRDEELRSVDQIDADNLKQIYKDDNVTVFDTRGHQSFAIGHIEGSTNIVDEMFMQLIEEGQVFPLDKRYVIACPGGELSLRIAGYMAQIGYDVSSLEGGIMSWKQKGFDLVR